MSVLQQRKRPVPTDVTALQQRKRPVPTDVTALQQRKRPVPTDVTALQQTKRPVPTDVTVLQQTKRPKRFPSQKEATPQLSAQPAAPLIDLSAATVQDVTSKKSGYKRIRLFPVQKHPVTLKAVLSSKERQQRLQKMVCIPSLFLYSY